MLDYPSARFRQVRADGYRICGLVNGKNALGAYSGWKAFGILDTPQRALLHIDEPSMTEVICTRALLATSTDYSDRLTHR